MKYVHVVFSLALDVFNFVFGKINLLNSFHQLVKLEEATNIGRKLVERIKKKEHWIQQSSESYWKWMKVCTLWVYSPTREPYKFV